jgi:hypothetical protein
MTDVMPEQQAVDLDELVGDERGGTEDLDEHGRLVSSHTA